IAAFALAGALGRPTWYLVFAVGSAGVLGALADRGSFGVASALLGGTLLVALVYPLVALVTFTTPTAVLDALARPDVRRTLYVSVYAPLLATGFATVLGVPLALLLRRGFRGQEIVEACVDLPLVVPHSVAGLAVLLAFGEGHALPWLPVLGAVPGLVLALAFVSAPYVVNGAREAFETVDPSIERAARSLGAGRFEVLRRVTVPLAAPRRLLRRRPLVGARRLGVRRRRRRRLQRLRLLSARRRARAGDVRLRLRRSRLDVDFRSAVAVAVCLL
ncbi:ABC transporter permease subunit, partial [Halarchaeum acidiphilum]|uniref:ABC transporter permease subunit n=1 Tax=Halarchaeum acidiphilum TaxID=489138 RepID=UPI000374D74B